MITTACNAATMPVIGPYLDELQKWLAAEGFGGSVLMMLSNGGVVAAEDAAQAPIRLVESGPAAGALAGSWFAERLGVDRLLCFDMGGTTAKSCLITDGEPRADEHVRGRPHLPLQEGLRLPGVGAVGRPRRDRRRRRQPRPPRRPRPAEGRSRVGRRRSRPGVLRPRRRPPGGHRRRPRARPARRRLLPRRRHAARPRRQPRPRSASVADCARSARSATPRPASTSSSTRTWPPSSRMHAVEQGEDLRGVPVLAFGGAGPIHACGVAELLESPQVVFPTNASVLSAFGTLVTPVRIDLARSKVRPLAPIDAGRARRAARRAARRGHPRAQRRRRPTPTRSGSATASTPATSARATRSRCGSARGRRGRRPTSRSSPSSRATTGGSTA